eukprot:CAMPEP_0194152122 /NCGR_PEP_ID=MMETSP0152-20130528/51000_1 /TAXON_ID=1049557 /ORGANISM="Thalassiothrix antarctica, Strain L6-D1" /LENGTH=313 /DNA_ID=CAMNT_0038856393 /DNA_START=110 /DNA_END=1051 /DNA_ORIENTATION=+
MENPSDTKSPYFELQKMLPNGTLVKADKKDTEVADMESKFNQAAKEVENLPTNKKLLWAEKQRNEGNNLYQEKNYIEAIDVYLTCLVAKSEELEFVDKVFLPVMNNLAQCTLQLGFYKKTQAFCTMAIEEDKIWFLDRPEAISKLYFRRARAYRMSGEYSKARKDLRKAKELLPQKSHSHRVIEKEFKMIEDSFKEAKKNLNKQQLAMKRLFERSPKSHLQPHVELNSGCISEHSELERTQPKEIRLYNRPKRKYSTLRARNETEPQEQEPRCNLSYWEYYLAVIGSITERLLILLGDEESIQQEQELMDKVN